MNLIDRGMLNDVNQIAQYKYTPLIKACRMKRVEVAAFFIDKGALVDARSEVSAYCRLVGLPARVVISKLASEVDRCVHV